MNIKYPKYYSSDRLEKIVKENDKQIKILSDSIIDLEQENERMHQWLNGERQFINQMNDSMSDTHKKELIDSVIERVEITKLSKQHYRLNVINKIGYIDKSYFTYTNRGHILTLQHVLPYGQTLNLSEAIQTHKRFERKRYTHPSDLDN